MLKKKFSTFFLLFATRDVKKICISGYSRIKPAMGNKLILKMDTRGNRYEYYLYPYINGTGTDIIVSILVDIHTRYTLI